MSLSCTQNKNSNANYKKDVEKAAINVVDNLVNYTTQKDIDQLINLFSESKEFQIIDREGIPKNYDDLSDFYSNFFNNLDQFQILESKLKIIPVNEDNAYCIWQGKEEIKLQDKNSIFSSWIATLIIENINGIWKITLFHATHY